MRTADPQRDGDEFLALTFVKVRAVAPGDVSDLVDEPGDMGGVILPLLLGRMVGFLSVPCGVGGGIGLVAAANDGLHFLFHRS